ncbi:MAG: hypothetical protein ACKOA5_06595 [Actinomycetota bacterium]
MQAKAVVVVLGLLVLSACGGNDNPTVDTTPIPTTVDIENTVENTAAPVDTVAPTTVEDDTVRISVTVGVDSGPDRIEEVAVGDAIELTMVNPDEDDEFHVHGFDLGGDETPAGEEKVFAFTATEAGDFEVESHVTGDVLVVIRVS